MKSMPKGDAPISRETVEFVKRKMAPPMGPPPAGMANFKAPKTYAPANSYRQNYEDSYGNNDRNNSDENDYSNVANNGYNSDNNQNDYYSGEDDYNRGNRVNNYQINTNSRDYDDEFDRSDDSPLRNKYGKSDFRGNFNDNYSDEEEEERNYQQRIQNRRNNHDDQDNDDSFYNTGNYVQSNNFDADPKYSSRQYQQQHQNDAKNQQNNHRSSPIITSAHQQAKQHQHQHSVPYVENRALTEKNLIVAGSNINNQSPGKIFLFNFQPILRATYRELKNFVSTPCTYGITTRCYIERNRSGSHMLAPYYSVCADLEDGTGRELMVCRKIMRSQTAHYIFSLKTEDLFRKREQRSKLYLGKLRATSANDYVLYDNGICDAPEDADVDYESDLDYAGNGHESAPGKEEGGVNRDNTALAKKYRRDMKNSGGGGGGAKGEGKEQEVSLYRKELCAIHFACKSRPAVGIMRGTEICIPNTFPSPEVSVALATPEGAKGLLPPGMKVNNRQVFTVAKNFEKIRNNGKQNELMARTNFIMHERTSKYDPLSSCLVDFRGRANVASVKNCIFVASDAAVPTKGNVLSIEENMKHDGEKEFLLQLGKTTEDCFNMDYRYPLSLLQAFAICIARFDAKLTW